MKKWMRALAASAALLPLAGCGLSGDQNVLDTCTPGNVLVDPCPCGVGQRERACGADRRWADWTGACRCEEDQVCETGEDCLAGLLCEGARCVRDCDGPEVIVGAGAGCTGCARCDTGLVCTTGVCQEPCGGGGCGCVHGSVRCADDARYQVCVLKPTGENGWSQPFSCPNLRCAGDACQGTPGNAIRITDLIPDPPYQTNMQVEMTGVNLGVESGIFRLFVDDQPVLAFAGDDSHVLFRLPGVSDLTTAGREVVLRADNADSTDHRILHLYPWFTSFNGPVWVEFLGAEPEILTADREARFRFRLHSGGPATGVVSIVAELTGLAWTGSLQVIDDSGALTSQIAVDPGQIRDFEVRIPVVPADADGLPITLRVAAVAGSSANTSGLIHFVVGQPAPEPDPAFSLYSLGGFPDASFAALSAAATVAVGEHAELLFRAEFAEAGAYEVTVSTSPAASNWQVVLEGGASTLNVKDGEGKIVQLNVWPLVDAQEIGEVELKIQRQGSPAARRVTLGLDPVPCASTCVPGGSECIGDLAFHACAEKAPGCFRWGASEACAAAERCREGRCVEPCTPGSCTNPGAPTCLDDTVLRAYSSEGAVCNLSDGNCQYPFTDQVCPCGCAGGACVDPPAGSAVTITASPERPVAGRLYTIQGAGFAVPAERNRVSFGDFPIDPRVLQYYGWAYGADESRLIVLVPRLAGLPGMMDLTVCNQQGMASVPVLVDPAGEESLAGKVRIAEGPAPAGAVAPGREIALTFQLSGETNIPAFYRLTPQFARVEGASREEWMANTVVLNESGQPTYYVELEAGLVRPVGLKLRVPAGAVSAAVSLRVTALGDDTGTLDESSSWIFLRNQEPVIASDDRIWFGSRIAASTFAQPLSQYELLGKSLVVPAGATDLAFRINADFTEGGTYRYSARVVPEEGAPWSAAIVSPSETPEVAGSDQNIIVSVAAASDIPAGELRFLEVEARRIDQDAIGEIASWYRTPIVAPECHPTDMTVAKFEFLAKEGLARLTDSGGEPGVDARLVVRRETAAVVDMQAFFVGSDAAPHLYDLVARLDPPAGGWAAGVNEVMQNPLSFGAGAADLLFDVTAPASDTTTLLQLMVIRRGATAQNCRRVTYRLVIE